MAETTAHNGSDWAPPKKVEELFANLEGNRFSKINSPKAGAREDKELPEGSAPVQLYSLFTPNGKITTSYVNRIFVWIFKT